MSLMSFLSKQFIDVIQWTEDGPGVLAYRYPMQDREIQNGGVLTVTDTQRAIFVNEGKVADTFGPGMHTLTTQTLPVLTYLQNWDKAFQSPFKSDVYFFSLREQLDQRWGTPQPITVRDKELGPLRIRANGVYSFRLADVGVFWSKLSGTTPLYTVNEATGQLRAAILTAIATGLGGSDVAFLDMAANQSAMSERLQAAVAPAFAGFGLQLTSFYLQSLSLPEEVQEHLDRRTSMGLVGDLQKYTQFQAADSIREAAMNQGGVAGAGAGLGAGMALGQAMVGAMGGGTQAQAGAPAIAPAAVPAAAKPAVDPIETITKLGELFQKGILTEAEFNAKKTELLSQIR